MSRFEFAISGPSSSKKTETAHDVASRLGENAVVISKGSFYRATATILNDSSINLQTSSKDDVSKTLRPMGYEIFNNNIVKAHINGNGIHHTHQNGNHASLYSQNPVIQEVLGNYFEELKDTLEERSYYYIGTEGRSWAPEGGLNVFLTAPREIRAQIKRIECAEEVCAKTDEEIKYEIGKRDTADFRNEHSLFRIPRKGIIVRRFDTSDETHIQIVKDISSAIRQVARDREALPHRQILWEYK